MVRIKEMALLQAIKLTIYGATKVVYLVVNNVTSLSYRLYGYLFGSKGTIKKHGFFC
jgi:hypothetical protein